MSETKRKVPKLLQHILKLDNYVTKQFTTWANGFLPLKTLGVHYKGLEISCHGIPWFAFWIAFTWLFDNPHLIQMQVNMLIGLFIDIILIAVFKAYFCRRRPAKNADDALGQMGPDVYSFPSGHASRAVFAAYFFTVLYTLPVIFYPPIFAWAMAVCLSRILVNRHYILDVVAGCLLGLFEGYLVGLIWLENDTAKWLISYISDEKSDGGEYHV